MEELETVLALHDNEATLIVHGFLDRADDKKFLLEMEKLLHTNASNLIVDLTHVDFLPSICFGRLIEFAHQAKESGRKIRARMRSYHARLAREIGVEAVLELEEVTE